MVWSKGELKNAVEVKQMIRNLHPPQLSSLRSLRSFAADQFWNSD